MKSPSTGLARLRASVLVSFLAVLAVLIGPSPTFALHPARAGVPALAAASSDDLLVARYRAMQAETGRYILDHYEPTGLGLEWKALGLARNRTPGAETWLSTYYTNLVGDVAKKAGKLGAATEFERVILAVTALGKDPADVGGYNLLAGLADQSKIVLLNQRVFALIALDSRHYDIPVVDGVTTPTTRQGLVDLILASELAHGGWAFFGTVPDPDMTAMTMQALTPYRSQPAVGAALDRGVAVLADIQKASGAYASFGESVESTVQVTVALTGLGIDPATDPRFVKSGGSAASAVTNFYIDGGGFWYNTASATRNSMSTEQGFYGISDYLRAVDGQKRLYDMTDLDDEVTQPLTPTLQASARATAYGRPVVIAVALSEQAPGEVSTVVSGRRYAAAVSGGKASLTLPARVLTPGAHRLTVSFGGSEGFNPTAGAVTTTVTTASAAIAVTPARSVRRGKKLTVKLAVSAAGVVPTGRVRVTFLGRSVTTTVNARGLATVRIPVKKGVKAGKRPVTAVYLGDRYVSGVSKTTGKVVKVTK
jgi:hypothetical protein